DAGAIHQNVQILYSGEQVSYLLFVGYVATPCLTAGEAARNVFRPCSININHQNPSPCFRKNTCGCLSNAAGPACNQRYFAIETKKLVHLTIYRTALYEDAPACSSLL